MLGRKIKMYRTNIGMKQSELADKLGMSQQVISSWEQGRSEPTALVIKELAAIFNVSFNELMDDNIQTQQYLQDYYSEEKRSTLAKILIKVEDLSHDEIKALKTVLDYYIQLKGSDKS